MVASNVLPETATRPPALRELSLKTLGKLQDTSAKHLTRTHQMVETMTNLTMMMNPTNVERHKIRLLAQMLQSGLDMLALTSRRIPEDTVPTMPVVGQGGLRYPDSSTASPV